MTRVLASVAFSLVLGGMLLTAVPQGHTGSRTTKYRIVFSRGRPHVGAVLVAVRSDGSGPLRRLTSRKPRRYDVAPAPSPTGRRLAFERYGASLTGVIFLATPAAKDAKRLGTYSQPSWSPDGLRIVAKRGGYGQSTGLFVIDVKTRVARRIPGTDRGAYPAWSPDGRWIAYTTLGPNERLVVTRPDGSESRVLVDNGDDLQDPAWSPNGRRIAFAQWDGSGSCEFLQRETLIVPAAGGSPRLLSRGAAGPAWSPDGRRIAVAGCDGIWLMSADGSNQLQLTEGRDSEPAWQRVP